MSFNKAPPKQSSPHCSGTLSLIVGWILRVGMIQSRYRRGILCRPSPEVCDNCPCTPTIATHCDPISQGYFPRLVLWRSPCQSKSPDRSHGRRLLFSCRARTLQCPPIRHAPMIVVPHRIPPHRGDSLVLSIGLGNAAEVLVRACTRPTRAPSDYAGYGRAYHSLACGAGSVGSNTCSRRPSDVTKPRQPHSAVATSRNVCPQGNLCARFRRDNR